jgi:hypothetical protein
MQVGDQRHMPQARAKGVAGVAPCHTDTTRLNEGRRHSRAVPHRHHTSERGASPQSRCATQTPHARARGVAAVALCHTDTTRPPPTPLPTAPLLRRSPGTGMRRARLPRAASSAARVLRLVPTPAHARGTVWRKTRTAPPLPPARTRRGVVATRAVSLSLEPTRTPARPTSVPNLTPPPPPVSSRGTHRYLRGLASIVSRSWMASTRAVMVSGATDLTRSYRRLLPAVLRAGGGGGR